MVIQEGNPSDVPETVDDHHPILFFTDHAAIRRSFRLVETGNYLRSMTVVGEDATQIMRLLFSAYRWMDAAGGVTITPDERILMIWRHSMWDLPKGKVEVGESLKKAAVREVEEETGLRKVELVRKLTTTYHTYVAASQNKILKRTTWYLMKHSGKGSLDPQVEEGIEAALWVKPGDLPDKMKHTYGTIQDVLDHALLSMHLL